MEWECSCTLTLKETALNTAWNCDFNKNFHSHSVQTLVHFTCEHKVVHVLHRSYMTVTVLLSSLCAVEEWLCQWVGEDPQLPWDSGRVPRYGCARHDKNSQGETDVTAGHLPHYKVLVKNKECLRSNPLGIVLNGHLLSIRNLIFSIDINTFFYKTSYLFVYQNKPDFSNASMPNVVLTKAAVQELCRYKDSRNIRSENK